ncbi:ABC transporter ATP-binding protein [Alphaproteobacteria bacterium 46_93_T64]|nr:ABC transporter ATP-binding protein [Alphaproteobacteria bacterium 46_93_T64]
MKLKLVAALMVAFFSIKPAMAAEKLTVLLDWFVNPDHAPLIIAKEKGIFKKNGLNVELIAPADPNDPPKLVAAGKAPLAVSYQPQLHVQVGEDLPLIRIGTLVATPLNSLVVLKDGPIKSIKDLKGKKVGFSVGGFEDALLKVMLNRHGLKLDDIEMINVNFSLSPSLLTGNVDAVIGAFRNFELNQMDIEGHPGLAFYPEEEGVPSYDELIIVANNDNLDDPRFKPFLNSLEESIQYIVNHPDDAWKLFIKNHKDLDDELNRRAWRDTIPRFALRPAAFDTNRYVRFAKFLKEAGLIKEVRKTSDYAVEIK